MTERLLTTHRFGDEYWAWVAHYRSAEGREVSEEAPPETLYNEYVEIWKRQREDELSKQSTQQLSSIATGRVFQLEKVTDELSEDDKTRASIFWFRPTDFKAVCLIEVL